MTLDKAKIEKKLADPGIYSGPSETLTRLQIELGQVEKKLENAENAWLEAESALENASM